MPNTLIKTVRIGGNYTKSQLSTGNWNSTGLPLILKQGQLAIEKDTGKGKWGDGITVYTALPYVFYEGGEVGEVYIPITTDPQHYTYTGLRTSPNVRFYRDSDVSGSKAIGPGVTYDTIYDPATKVITFRYIPAGDNVVAVVS